MFPFLSKGWLFATSLLSVVKWEDVRLFNLLNPVNRKTQNLFK